jgi:hypothetical protein
VEALFDIFQDVMAEAPETVEAAAVNAILQPPPPAAAAGPVSNSDFSEETEHTYSNCPNSCCTGAFIKETMAGILMSHDIKELVFTTENVSTRKSAFPNCLEFDSPVVLTHLLSATHQHFSQLEKLVFSEHFVKEEATGNC